jgi:hypothetical protein
MSSPAGNAIATRMSELLQTALSAFVAGLNGRKILTLAEISTRQSLVNQTHGQAVDEAIAAGLANRPRIFVGTSPEPNPALFQEGDIYFQREE